MQIKLTIEIVDMPVEMLEVAARRVAYDVLTEVAAELLRTASIWRPADTGGDVGDSIDLH